MTRRQRRQRLLINWLGLGVLALAPLVILWAWLGVSRSPSAWAMPIFIGALISLFVSLPLFGRYKRALIAAGKARDTESESADWQTMVRAQQCGLFGAALPAWIGALGLLAGLEAVPLVLLALATLTIFWVYRLPAQLD